MHLKVICIQYLVFYKDFKKKKIKKTIFLGELNMVNDKSITHRS